MRKKKFVSIGAIVGTLALAQGVFAAEIAVIPSQNVLSIQSGGTVNTADDVPAYMYQDSNYFMLRDIGRIVGYRIDWDGNTKKITMTKDKTAQNFNGLSAAKHTENVKKNHQTIVIDGNEYKNMECLNIEGYNYFKLRDLAGAMDFTCDWNNDTNTIMLTTDNENITETTGPQISVDRFLDPDLNQKIIEEDVAYVLGSKNYNEIEKYMRENIDKDFNAEDYVIKEDNYNGLIQDYIVLDIRLDVNGVQTNNFGYRIHCANGKAILITFIGEKNPDFDVAKAGTQQLSDEEAKRKAIEADGYSYEVDEQRIYRFFDMKELINKCEVETVYIDNGGHYFATSHIF